jgi:hypothetical protein
MAVAVAASHSLDISIARPHPPPFPPPRRSPCGSPRAAPPHERVQHARCTCRKRCDRGETHPGLVTEINNLGCRVRYVPKISIGCHDVSKMPRGGSPATLRPGHTYAPPLHAVRAAPSVAPSRRASRHNQGTVYHKRVPPPLP